MIEVVMIVFMTIINVMVKVNSISQEYLNNDLVISRSHPFSLPPQVMKTKVMRNNDDDEDHDDGGHDVDVDANADDEGDTKQYY